MRNAETLDYWRGKCLNAHIFSDITNTDMDGYCDIKYEIPVSITEMLFRICKNDDELIFDMLFAVLAILLHETSLEKNISTLLIKEKDAQVICMPIEIPIPLESMKKYSLQIHEQIKASEKFAIDINEVTDDDLCYQIMYGNIPKELITYSLPDIYVNYQKNADSLLIYFTYNKSCISRDFISKISECYSFILEQVMSMPDTPLSYLQICPEREKNAFLKDFDKNTKNYKPINSDALLKRSFIKYSNRTAISQTMKWDEIIRTNDKCGYEWEFFLRCSFSVNKYMHIFSRGDYIQSLLHLEDVYGWKLIRTNKKNNIVVNSAATIFLEIINQYHIVDQIIKNLISINRPIIIYDIGALDNYNEEKVSKFQFDTQEKDTFPKLIKKLMDLNILVEGVEYGTPMCLNKLHAVDTPIRLTAVENSNQEVDVLLLGDTPGTSTIGLLYLASYLQRNGVKTKCQLNYSRYISLEPYIKELLTRYSPKYIGISMKWFPHIERVHAICRLVKKYMPNTKIILGGNSAAQFSHELIQFEYIDYIVCGDGELPILEICLEKEHICNVIYKRNGEIIQNAITYVQDENTNDIYLSDLEEILPANAHFLYMDSMYIYVGKGCSQHCEYCAGHTDTQQELFGRSESFIRPVDLIRKDIQLLKPLVSTFLFDFDLIEDINYQVYQDIWADMELNEHLCVFYLWKIPPKEFIKLISDTFCYVTLNLDVPCLSQNMRKELTKTWNIKYLFNNEDIINFMSECEKYDNIEVRISTIGGLHHDENAFEEELSFANILYSYSCFRGLDWEALHAQPGAPILKHCEQYGLYTQADTYESFWQYSKLNQSKKIYPSYENLAYPAIRYKDNSYNDMVFNHYQKILSLQKVYQKHAGELCRQYTYKELNQYIDRLVYKIKSSDVHGYIAVYMERCIEYVVAILAILKADCSYIPLTAAMSEEQILSILKSSSCNMVITFCSHAQQVKKWPVSIMEIGGMQEGKSINKNDILNKKTETAYLIFTSGSTGESKGVPIEKNGLGNLQHTFHDILNIRETDKIALFASFSFDASVWEMYMAMFNGAALIILSDDVIYNINEFTRVINTNGITVITLPPHYLNLLNPESFYTLKKVIVAGSSPDDVTLRKWSNYVDVYNAYGPTEATVCASIGKYNPFVTPSIHIGYPIPNTNIAILNKHNKLCPANIFGNICISGPGVTKGYINDPDLFQRKTFTGIFGENIWYVTGDIGRYLPDGRIEYLGRTDRQVKVNGYRIELERIEKILNMQKNICNSAVIIKNDTRIHSKIIIAFIETKSKIDISELQEALKCYLATYEIPNRIVPVYELPLNSHGKINYQKLNELLFDSYVSIEDFICENELERKIFNIWSKILEVNINCRKDNFFEFGGNSLLAMQLVSEIENEMQVRIKVVDLFLYPTFEEFTKFISERVEM